MLVNIYAIGTLRAVGHALPRSVFKAREEPASTYSSGLRLQRYTRKEQQRDIMILISGWICGKSSFPVFLHLKALVGTYSSAILHISN
jgi:hypothetical protein